MKKIIALFVFILGGINAFAQTWTTEQLAAAGTARDIDYLTQVEKDAVMYINLARLYPQQFAEYALKDYIGTAEYVEYLKQSGEKSRYARSKYKASLMKTLKSMDAVEALVFNKDLYEDARCFAAELGTSGREGHNRKQCEKHNYAECVSMGMPTGKDIAMQLLIDHDVPSLGHRKICLDSSFFKIGISMHDHTKWNTCAVLELIW